MVLKNLLKSIIICYSLPNYDKLTDIFIKSLLSLGVNKLNINIIKNNNFWDVLETYKNNNKYEYFIYSECDIYFLQNNKDEWNNLEKYINNNNHDIYFMEDKRNINKRFFIIKNNKNISSIISFFKNNKNDINYGTIPKQYIINGIKIFNENKSLIQYTYGNNITDKLEQIKYIMEHFNLKNLKNLKNPKEKKKN